MSETPTRPHQALGYQSPRTKPPLISAVGGLNGLRGDDAGR
jgi:hypothetical protein